MQIHSIVFARYLTTWEGRGITIILYLIVNHRLFTEIGFFYVAWKFGHCNGDFFNTVTGKRIEEKKSGGHAWC